MAHNAAFNGVDPGIALAGALGEGLGRLPLLYAVPALGQRAVRAIGNGQLTPDAFLQWPNNLTANELTVLRNQVVVTHSHAAVAEPTDEQLRLAAGLATANVVCAVAALLGVGCEEGLCPDEIPQFRAADTTLQDAATGLTEHSVREHAAAFFGVAERTLANLALDKTTSRYGGELTTISGRYPPNPRPELAAWRRGEIDVVRRKMNGLVRKRLQTEVRRAEIEGSVTVDGVRLAFPDVSDSHLAAIHGLTHVIPAPAWQYNIAPAA